MADKWVKRINSNIPVDVYSPINLETGQLTLGLGYIGEPDGEVVGEYWFEKGEIKVRLFDISRKSSEGETIES